MAIRKGSPHKTELMVLYAVLVWRPQLDTFLLASLGKDRHFRDIELSVLLPGSPTGPHKPVLPVLFVLYCCGKMLSKSDLGKQRASFLAKSIIKDAVRVCSIAVIKTMAKSKMRREGLIWLTYISSLRQSGRKWRRNHREMLLTDLLLEACAVWSQTPPGSASEGWHQTGWTGPSHTNHEPRKQPFV